MSINESIQEPKKYYVGLNTSYHDPAIALVDDEGYIIFAQATERHTQNKRSLFSVADDFTFVESIIANYTFSDYEIAANYKEYKNLLSKLVFNVISYDTSHKLDFINRFSLYVSNIKFPGIVHFQHFTHVANYSLRNFSGHTFRFLLSFKNKLPLKPYNNFDHHLCHATYSYYTSNYKSAIIVIVDGSGDYGRAISVYKADENEVTQLSRNKSSASLGAFYWILTYLCGMDNFKGEEWKVMGLAPYGKFNQDIYNDFKNWMFVDDTELCVNTRKMVDFINQTFHKKKYEHISKADLAFTGQFFYEELLFELINNIYKKYPHENVIIAGGCALNSAANGKIHTRTPYKNVYISSAPADDGCAIGAALLNFKKSNTKKNIPYFQKNPYLGFNINNAELELFKKHSNFKHQTLAYDDLYKVIARELFDGKIIGWVQGRAEFGPRALGNRSILANPCLPEMKDKINSSIKFREEFRPFAPSILEEYGADYFEDYHSTPYMERVLQIKKHKQSEIPAVTHIDGSGRVQTVTKELNKHYYNLITEFYKLSNVPIILNTSLNVMGKPIVNSVDDMAGIFTLSGLNILVINNTIFYKN